MEKTGEKRLQNKKNYSHAIWDAWYTHTQMAHGKKSWFCSNFSSLFFIFIHFSRQCWKVEKSGEKWRQHEANKRKRAWGAKALRLWDHSPANIAKHMHNIIIQMAMNWKVFYRPVSTHTQMASHFYCDTKNMHTLRWHLLDVCGLEWYKNAIWSDWRLCAIWVWCSIYSHEMWVYKSWNNIQVNDW